MLHADGSENPERGVDEITDLPDFARPVGGHLDDEVLVVISEILADNAGDTHRGIHAGRRLEHAVGGA